MADESIYDFVQKNRKTLIGTKQNADGKVRSRFIEKFFERVPKNQRSQIESLIKKTYECRNFNRFRFQMIFILAGFYGVNATDLLKEMRSEVSREVASKLLPIIEQKRPQA
jgi:hypothetical protein